MPPVAAFGVWLGVLVWLTLVVLLLLATLAIPAPSPPLLALGGEAVFAVGEAAEMLDLTAEVTVTTFTATPLSVGMLPDPLDPPPRRYDDSRMWSVFLLCLLSQKGRI